MISKVPQGLIYEPLRFIFLSFATANYAMKICE